MEFPDTKPIIKSVMYATGCHYYDAEDAIQDAIIKILERDTSPDDHLAGLIRRIAIRLIYRQRRRHKTISFSDTPDCPETVDMPQLTPKQRAVVKLRLEGYTDAEIARKWNVSRQAIGKIRKRIQKRWKKAR